jgi:hypothetical protein
MTTNPPFDRGYVIRVIKKVLQNFRNQGHPFIGFVAFQRQLVVAAFNLPDSGSTRVDDHINGMYDSNHPARQLDCFLPMFFRNSA